MKWYLKQVLFILLPNNPLFLLKEYSQNGLIFPTSEACLCSGAMLQHSLTLVRVKKKASQKVKKAASNFITYFTHFTHDKYYTFSITHQEKKTTQNNNLRAFSIKAEERLNFSLRKTVSISSPLKVLGDFSTSWLMKITVSCRNQSGIPSYRIAD